MSWKVELTKNARGEFRKLEHGPLVEAAGLIQDLEDGPNAVEAKELSHYPGTFTTRFFRDLYRLIFTVHRSKNLIRVLRIDHRSDSYRGMKRANP